LPFRFFSEYRRPRQWKNDMKKFQTLEKKKGGGSASLEKRIGYRFKNKQRLKAALTHPSFRYENPEVPSDNQRLEFLGDSVLGLLAADALMKHHPDAPEGDLTKLKSVLTSGVSLAKVAARLELGSYLLLGRGEAAAGGAERESNLEDVLEALIGAIWLDGGLKAIRKFFDRHVFQTLETAEPALLNPKGTLQEYAQKNGFGIPEYAVTAESGPDHDRRFTVQVTVSTFGFTGEGRSRREAEKNAAEKAVKGLVN
jgi:ribonuclease-3